MRVGVLLAILSGAVLGGCFGFVPTPETTLSYGRASSGFLRAGVGLASQGEGFVRARPTDPTRFGTTELVQAIERAASSVASAYPGAAPVRVGDLSFERGGRHPRHGSHRSGRDVDVVFYVTDSDGHSVRGRGWLAYDRFGVARESSAPEGMTPSDEVFFFDVARNWHFVRTLLLDERAYVQWIFCSYGLKARLLTYAAEHETNPDVLFRAAWVLHQPSRGAPHADHFHIRIACSPEQRSLGCDDDGPLWPWFRPALEKPVVAASEALTDAALVDALLAGDVEVRAEGD